MYHVERVYFAEQDASRRRRAEEIHRHRLAAQQGRKLRKRDGRSENAEAGDPRPPAVDC
ncbi:MAG TPA: hypothetical protein VFN97_00150 [Actinospica sp.]|nr:hypothetical protein [Actinospica sp.]